MTNFAFNPSEQIPFPAYAETKKFLPLSATDGTLDGDGRRYALYTYIAGFSVPVSTTDIKQPESVIIASDSFDAFDIYTVESVIKGVEVQNFTTGTVYIVPSSTSFENATAKGIGIGATGLYSTDRTITGFTMATVSAGDVRILLYT